MEITGKELIERTSGGLTLLFQNWAEAIFGTRVRERIFGPVAWSDLFVLACFLAGVFVLHALVAAFLRRKIKKAKSQPADNATWLHALWTALRKPLYVLIWIYGAYFAAVPFLLKFGSPSAQETAGNVFDFAVFATLVWFVFRLTRVMERVLAHFARRSNTKFDDLLIPLAGRVLRVIVPVLGMILGLPLIGLSAESNDFLKKASGILIIACVAWVLFEGVRVFERYILAKYDIKATNNLEARKIYTQVQVLSKTLYFLISLFTVASMLMLFDEVRRFGTSILASAGVVGIIIGFAAQRTIANLFAGFQLAMAQPIRIEDVVIVEGEWGRVEEITLTYVVIKIWDQRRLIVPLSQFIEKPFQNWTRTSAEITGSVFFYVDYTLPLDKIRAEVKRLVENNPNWDKKFWNLQVTDTTDRSMQIRVLVTAEDSGKAWDLRCALREQLIDFMQRNFPESLPRFRADVLSPDAKGRSSMFDTPPAVPGV